MADIFGRISEITSYNSNETNWGKCVNRNCKSMFFPTSIEIFRTSDQQFLAGLSRLHFILRSQRILFENIFSTKKGIICRKESLILKTFHVHLPILRDKFLFSWQENVVTAVKTAFYRSRGKISGKLSVLNCINSKISLECLQTFSCLLAKKAAGYTKRILTCLEEVFKDFHLWENALNYYGIGWSISRTFADIYKQGWQNRFLQIQRNHLWKIYDRKTVIV